MKIYTLNKRFDEAMPITKYVLTQEMSITAYPVKRINTNVFSVWPPVPWEKWTMYFSRDQGTNGFNNIYPCKAGDYFYIRGSLDAFGTSDLYGNETVDYQSQKVWQIYGFHSDDSAIEERTYSGSAYWSFPLQGRLITADVFNLLKTQKWGGTPYLI